MSFNCLWFFPFILSASSAIKASCSCYTLLFSASLSSQFPLFLPACLFPCLINSLPVYFITGSPLPLYIAFLLTSPVLLLFSALRYLLFTKNPDLKKMYPRKMIGKVSTREKSKFPLKGVYITETLASSLRLGMITFNVGRCF